MNWKGVLRLINVKEFIGLYTDLVFKHIFGKEENVVDLLNSYYDYIGVSESVYLVQLNRQCYVQKDNINRKDNYLDILGFLTDGTMINVEMYNNFSVVEKKKSLTYASSLYGNQMEKKESYNDVKKVISLNFVNSKLSDYKNLVSIHNLKDLVTSVKYLDEDIEMIVVCLDNVSEIEYSKDEPRFITWCRLISAKTSEDFCKYAKGDEKMTKVYNEMKAYTSDPVFGKFIQNDNWKIESAELRGKEQQAMNTAKAMFKEKCNINLISRVTNLSINELKKLDY